MSKDTKQLTVEVGDTVFLKPINNKGRRNTEIQEAVVTKVGAKYFYTDGYGRFLIQTLMQDCGQYSSNYQAYFCMQQVTDEIELHSIHQYISKHFSMIGIPTLSLDKLRKIKDIINS